MNAAPLLSPCADTDLLARYTSYFRTQLAETPALVRTAQAIRYQVYCLERKFEDEAEHGDRMESDAFDSNAVHSLIFHRPTSEAIGTARLIPLSGGATANPECNGGVASDSVVRRGATTNMNDVLQPIRQLLRDNGLRARDHVPLATTAEVSRFAISNQFRRRSSDNGSAGHAPECRTNLPCLGLVQELLRQSVARGFTHWAAVMEPKLLRMLAVMGIHFAPVGPLVDHHGLRQPSYCDLAQMLERLKRERFDHWMVVTDGGALVPGQVEERRAA